MPHKLGHPFYSDTVEFFAKKNKKNKQDNGCHVCTITKNIYQEKGWKLNDIRLKRGKGKLYKCFSDLTIRLAPIWNK